MPGGLKPTKQVLGVYAPSPAEQLDRQCISGVGRTSFQLFRHSGSVAADGYLADLLIFDRALRSGRLRHTGEDGMVVPDAPSDESFSSFGSG